MNDAASLTQGHLLGGRVAYAQPADGYRSGIEPVLLAAAVPARPGQAVIEAGTGAGAGMLCLAARVPGLHGLAVERDAPTAALAAANIAANRLPAITALAADITAATLPAATLSTTGAPFDHGFANPPWHAARATPSPHAQRDGARRAPAGMEALWVSGFARVLAARASLTLVVPAAVMPGWIGAMAAASFGGLVIFPLWPHAGRAAKLVLLQGLKGARGPARLAAGLVLHEPSGAFTQATQAILRDGAPLTLT